MFKKGKVFISFIAIILCSLLLTGCGKSDIEKFKEYLVEEAGYTKVNEENFKKSDGEYVYEIRLDKKDFYRTDNSGYVYYNYGEHSGMSSHKDESYSISVCSYDFVLDKLNEASLCNDKELAKNDMLKIKSIFDGYLAAVGIDRLDLLETEE